MPQCQEEKPQKDKEMSQGRIGVHTQNQEQGKSRMAEWPKRGGACTGSEGLLVPVYVHVHVCMYSRVL